MCLEIFLWCLGLKKFGTTDVDYYVRENQIDILALQETLDGDGSLLNLRGYQCFHLPHGSGKRGMALYISNSVPCELIQDPSKVGNVESICVTITLQDRTVNIVNTYIGQNGLIVDDLPEIQTY